jgi:excisionase family DNA binding protein
MGAPTHVPWQAAGIEPAAANATGADTETLARLLHFVEAREAKHGSATASPVYLAGADNEDRVELTEEVRSILAQVVTALSKGQAVSVVARDQEISTQQAAEILGISRPTVVRLITDGELPAHIPGSERRKLRLADVLAYRDELYARRNRFIAESSAEYDDAENNEMAELLAKARTAN